ncbi:Zinc finger protein BRUTUS-like [Sesamum alatum]|uniref:Zinc finger protein BRUTUS-like n=1 Tax=Sesamum alatum TaxID=300844 RepID=A0AAE1YVY9_9LAMI|nr:Zinc finger protein BRUTUS-like [Sesamum alatum]
MGGGESEKEEDWPVTWIAGVRLVDAPVLFFVATHKAFRAELAALRRYAAEAAESGVCGGEVVGYLRRRLEFLRLVYNYHTAAEDEVIFLALDAQVKNVVSTYSLEHKTIDDNFSSVFRHLDLLMKSDEDAPHMFQELLFSIVSIQSMICQHMQKEEEQVFPLVKQKFTSEQQSQLVWQYMCSVPIILLEEFLPWMTLYLTSDEKLDIIGCIKLITPKERILQEVVLSWIQKVERSSSDAGNIHGKGCQLLNGLSSSKDLYMLYSPQIQCEEAQQLEKAFPVQIRGVGVPIKGICIWHSALRRDFGDIIQELYQIRSSNCSSSLSSVVVQLKFIADVLIFYSDSLDKIVYPFLSQFANKNLSSCSPLIDESQIKNLRVLLFYEAQGSDQNRGSFIELLCQELESLKRWFSKKLIFLETEVFPSIHESCASEMQLWFLYTSLHMMPLGLLRCSVTWFSSHLTENQSNSILKNMKSGCPSISKPFISLLHEWVRIGCSGKTSVDKFRQNLEEMFNGRCFYLTKQNRQGTVFSNELPGPNSTIKMRVSVDIPSSSVSVTTEEHDMSYPSEMNLHISFSQMFKKMPPLQKNLADSDDAVSLNLESRPMDLILYIHRALIKDLEHLVILSAKLAANVGFLSEFKNRFKLLHNIYQVHSISEDEIAFPALESKGVHQNISHSYCIDHKLETKHLRRTSIILDEISELNYREGCNVTRLKYYRLCLKLHETCLSMHKVLSDHIYREEVEIFPLFRQCFSTEEEEKIVGHMLGRTRAEFLQEMIPWLMAYLRSGEQHVVMSLWLRIARYTKFDEWLGEWWEGMTIYNTSTVEEGSRSPSLAADPLEIVSMYLMENDAKIKKVRHDRGTPKEFAFDDFNYSGSCTVDKSVLACGSQDGCQSQDLSQYQSEVDKKRSNEANDNCHECQKLSHHEHPLGMNQEELEATIRRISRDSNLDSQKKSYIIQNLLMSRWILKQKMSHQEASMENHKGEIPGKSPSYKDPLGSTFGCKHYKRNCKVLAPCCNKLYTCIRCHDDEADHSVDRKAITKMMCMKCLVIQPIGPICMSQSCSGFSMGRYYCKICKLFDDERQIYHCPYCNLCRLGKGLGIDYFHCMKCNACMARSLLVHVCREKCLEDNCPICHEYIFTSNSPVKALPCGHLMHSACFQDYTCSHYTCPICSKSLGNMQVYFEMLDALLAEEKIPEEYAGQIQVILCNDCEKRGTASFHWLYHKCPYCGSYNTRLL